MEGEKILMSQRHLQRWHLMKMVEVGHIWEDLQERTGKRQFVNFLSSQRDAQKPLKN